MPRSHRVPQYTLHKPSGQARVIISGRHIYLGRYGSNESKEEYNRLIADFLSAARFEASSGDYPPSSISIVELCAAYLTHAESYYVKDGRPTGQLAHVKRAIRVLNDHYGAFEASKFGPRALRAIQDVLANSKRHRQKSVDGEQRETESTRQTKLSRSYVNGVCGTIKRIFRWGVSHELLPVATYQALLTVPGLKRGRTVAREAEPILPADDATVEKTLEHLPSVVADMVRFQRLTGCRPGEVCSIRPGDVDTSGPVWLYQPESHKTEHHGRQRTIFIGPKAQAVLRPYLLRSAESYCFSPRDSEKKRREAVHGRRRTPPTYGNRPGTNRRRKPVRRPGNKYTKDSYNRAIRRACEAAGIEPWSPNRLRHSAATELRKRYGLEAAQVVLGHAKADVTQIYAERDHALAARIMREVG